MVRVNLCSLYPSQLWSFSAYSLTFKLFYDTSGGLFKKLFGGRILCLVIISSRETHVPIPNTLVKPLAANGSAVYCGVRVGRRQAFFVFYIFDFWN